MVTKNIIIYTFQSLEDPLVKGLMLQYLKGLKSSDCKFHFHLITHEQKEFALAPSNIASKKIELSDWNINWYPVEYRSGTFLLLKKVFNFLQTFFISLRIKRKYKPVAILGFLSIAGGYSYILSKLLRLKLIVYCFEPHSHYMLDFNVWSKNSLKYKLLHRFEESQLKNSDYVVVPNNFTKALVEEINKSTRIFVCPISVDTNQIVFDQTARVKIRKEINAKDNTVVVYTGKFGGIYYSTDEIIKFFCDLYNYNNKLFFYIITPNLEDVKLSIAKFKLPESAYSVSLTVSYNELNQHISAADIGMVAVPSYPSQKYRTPVKTAIYLSCGIPFIVNKNIGDDDNVALNENIGVVIDNLEGPPSQLSNKINQLLSNNASDLKMRCRSYAVANRSTSKAVAILNNIFSEI